MAGKNEFVVKVDGGEDLTLKIISITPEIRLDSNEHYSKAWYQALDKKFPLRIELEKILESKGLHDPKADEAKRSALFKELNELEIKLRSGKMGNRRMTRQEGKVIALKMKDLRNQLLQIGTSISDYFANSAEHFADNERFQYFIYACTVDANTGQRYWKSYEHFKSAAEGKSTDLDSKVYGEAAQAFLLAVSGVDKDFDKSYYENVWLRRAGYINDKMQLLRDDGKPVDAEGRLINEDWKYVDEQGNFVDKYGNPVDKDGNLLVEDNWAFESEKVPAEVK